MIKTMNVRKAFGKHIAFPILNLKNQTANQLKHLETSQWFALERIQSLQWNKLADLLKHAASNVPHYRKVFQERGISAEDIRSFDDFRVLPLLQKRDVREDFANMIASGFDRSSLKPFTTSGSTGEPVTILRDSRADIIASASGIRFRRWAGQEIGVKYAQIWGRALGPVQSSDSGHSPRSRLKRWLARFEEPAAFLNAYDMTETNMREFADKIAAQKVDVLVGYVNMLYFFAQSVQKWEMAFRLKSVRTTAEVLHTHQRQLIEEVFGCKVFDNYGNRENGLIAAECDMHCGLHVNAENLYVEILDPQGKPVQGNESGEIVITDLNNYGMPLIRYRTGDRGYVLKEPCQCGRRLPLIGEIGGRVIDMVALSDGNFVDGRVLGHALWAFPDEIDRFTVVQHKRGEAELMLKPAKPIADERLQIIMNCLRDFTRNKLTIKLKIVDDLPIDPVSGKYRFVVSDIRSGIDSNEPEQYGR